MLITGDAARHAHVPELIRQRLDRFEKLCFGLSMVHELTPRLLDAISGTGEMLSAPLLSAAIAAQGRPSESVEACACGSFLSVPPIFPGACDMRRRTRTRR